MDLDWVVGAPTAGSGNNPGFPEQAGWVGWFEQNDLSGSFVKSGLVSLDHFGWSKVYSKPTPNALCLQVPGSSTVSSTLCSQR